MIKHNNTLLYTIITIITLISVILIVACYKLYKQKRVVYENVTYESDERQLEGMENDLRLIDISNELCSDNGIICKISDILNPDSMYLVVHLVGNGCDECIKSAIQTCSSDQYVVSCVKLVFIASNMTMREMRFWLRDVKTKFPIYLMKEQTLGLPADGGEPYAMFINDGKIAKHVLILSGSYPYLWRDYLDFIKQRYCQTNE